MLSAADPPASQNRSRDVVPRTNKLVASAPPKASAEAIRLMKLMESTSTNKNDETLAKAKVAEIIEMMAADSAFDIKQMNEDEIFLALYDHDYNVDATMEYLKRRYILVDASNAAADKENSDIEDKCEKWIPVEHKRSKVHSTSESETRHHPFNKDNHFTANSSYHNHEGQRYARRPNRMMPNRGRSGRPFRYGKPEKLTHDAALNDDNKDTPSSTFRSDGIRGRGYYRRRGYPRQGDESQRGFRRGDGSRRERPFPSNREERVEESGSTQNDGGPRGRGNKFGGNRRFAPPNRFSSRQGYTRMLRTSPRAPRPNYGNVDVGALCSPLLELELDEMFTSSGDFVNGQVFTRRVVVPQHPVLTHPPHVERHFAPFKARPTELVRDQNTVEQPPQQCAEGNSETAIGSGSWADLARRRRQMN